MIDGIRVNYSVVTYSSGTKTINEV